MGENVGRDEDAAAVEEEEEVTIQGTREDARGLQTHWVEHGGQDAREWHAIARPMIQQDPQWGELLDWRAAPPPPEPDPFSRREIWFEFTRLVLDGPFLVMGFLTIISVWRVQVLRRDLRAASRRGLRRHRAQRVVTGKHFAFTIRDLLCLPLVPLVLLTHRGPRLVMQLLARRKQPLRGDAALEVVALEVETPDEGKLSLHVRARLAERVGAFEPGSLRLQVLGPGFWRAVGRWLTGAGAGVVQSYLPLKFKSSDSNLSEELLRITEPGGARKALESQQEFTFFLRSKQNFSRRRIMEALAKLNPAEWVLLQLEGRDHAAKTQQVVFAAAVQLSALVPLVRAGRGEVTRGQLGDEEQVLECYGAQHRGAVESFAAIVFGQAAQLLLDFLHLLLFILVVLVPWRFLETIVVLLEPADRWACRLTDQALELMEGADLALEELRSEILPECNAAAKDTALAMSWTSSGRVPSIISRFGGKPLSEEEHEGIGLDAFFRAREGALLSEQQHFTWLFRRKTSALPLRIAEKMTNRLRMQDARCYYTGLSSYVNCLLSSDQISVEEHGIVVALVREAERRFVQATVSAREDILLEAKRTRDEVRARSLGESGSRLKETSRVRTIIRIYAWAALVAVIILFITVYRVPVTFAELHAAGLLTRPTSYRFKAVVVRSLRCLGYELLFFVEILLLWVAVIITI